jgi:hypothetical protein
LEELFRGNGVICRTQRVIHLLAVLPLADLSERVKARRAQKYKFSLYSERIFSALDIRPAGAAFLENAGWNYFVYLLKH